MRQDLVRAAQDGDHDAFEDLAGDALEQVYGAARLILLREDLARDATRDTLVAAWRDIRGLRESDELTSWLYRSLVRSCRRLAATATETPTPERGDSEQAFARLSLDQRMILVLTHHANLGVADAGAVLGIPVATAEARRDEAFDALRVALELDDTEAVRTDLGWRIRPWMDQVAASPELSVVLDEVIDATRATPRRPRLLTTRIGRPTRRGRRLPGRRGWLALVGALAVGVAATGGLLLGRTVRPPTVTTDAPPGAFRPSGEIAALAGTLFDPTIAVLADGRVLVIGIGDQLIGAMLYDPATESYGDPIRDSVLRHDSTATTLLNNLVLLTGGNFGNPEPAAQTAVLFDPVSKTFASTNPMGVARTNHQATLLDDGRVLVTGGHHPFPGGSSPDPQSTGDDTAEIYDPATGTFGPTGPMLRHRAGHTATKLADGRVLIVGGYAVGADDDTTLHAVAEIFDPATGQFGAAGVLALPRTGHSATLLADGRVLIVGGSNEADPFGGLAHPLRLAEVFDPKTLAFTPVASLTTERAHHSATLLADGRVLIAGGWNEYGGPLSTEMFDPVAGMFTLGPRAGAPHDATLAPVLGNGRVLLVGSGAGGSEVFDPAAGAVAVAASASPGISPSSPLETSGRYDRPALVTLDDGRILIVGDEAAEIFDPLAGRTIPLDSEAPRLSVPLTTRLPDGSIFITGWGPDGVTGARIFDPRTDTFRPASESTLALLRGYQRVYASSLLDGRFAMYDGGADILTFDPQTGVTGPPVTTCYSPFAAIGIDAARALVSCTDDQEARLVDLVAGTTEPTGLRFDEAFRLDERRLALIRYGRLSWIYDTTSRQITEVPEEVDVGATFAVVGDRLLAFGSRDGLSDQAAAYDTRTWTRTDLGRMLAKREGASAAVLSDGRVLLVGGARQPPDRTDPIPPGSEIFDPSAAP